MISVHKYLLYGVIYLILFLILFTGGISLMFLGALSIIPRYFISVGLMLIAFCYILISQSIHYFIEYGKAKENIKLTKK